MAWLILPHTGRSCAALKMPSPCLPTTHIRPGRANIVDVAVNEPSLSTLVAAVQVRFRVATRRLHPPHAAAVHANPLPLRGTANTPLLGLNTACGAAAWQPAAVWAAGAAIGRPSPLEGGDTWSPRGGGPTTASACMRLGGCSSTHSFNHASLSPQAANVTDLLANPEVRNQRMEGRGVEEERRGGPSVVVSSSPRARVSNSATPPHCRRCP